MNRQEIATYFTKADIVLLHGPKPKTRLRRHRIHSCLLEALYYGLGYEVNQVNDTILRKLHGNKKKGTVDDECCKITGRTKVATIRRASPKTIDPHVLNQIRRGKEITYGFFGTGWSTETVTASLLIDLPNSNESPGLEQVCPELEGSIHEVYLDGVDDGREYAELAHGMADEISQEPVHIRVDLAHFREGEDAEPPAYSPSALRFLEQAVEEDWLGFNKTGEGMERRTVKLRDSYEAPKVERVPKVRQIPRVKPVSKVKPVPKVKQVHVSWWERLFGKSGR